jgi:ElaA protein
MLESSTLVWELKPFSELRAIELHRLLMLRAVVFVVEQACAYQDPDEKDEHALHVMVACARILPAGISYQDVSIGRVATSGDVRGSGVGRMLMLRSLEEISVRFGAVPVRISAQSYLQKFYENLGFIRTEKAEYLEDDIPHMEMLRS